MNETEDESEDPEDPEELEETLKKQKKLNPVSYINPEGMTAQTRINTPESYSRIEAASGSF